MIRKCTRFVKYEHLATGKVDNMPEEHWNTHIVRNRQRKNEFKFIEVIDLSAGVPIAREGRVDKLVVEEDPLECPLCGEIAEDESSLREHKEEKH